MRRFVTITARAEIIDDRRIINKISAVDVSKDFESNANETHLNFLSK